MQQNVTTDTEVRTEPRSFVCKKCGQEIPEGAKFCPFCAAPVDFPAQKKSGKIIAACIAAAAVICIAAGAGLYIHFKSAPEEAAEAVTYTAEPAAASVTPPAAKAAPKEVAALTADETLRNEYFVYEPLLLFWMSPKAILRNPAMFEGVKIGVFGTVEKILPTDADNKFSLLCKEDENPIVLEGTYSGSARYLEGDIVYIKGYYGGTRNITVDGKSMNVGVLTGCAEVRGFHENGEAAYSLDEARRIIRLIFGAEVDVQSSVAEDGGAWYKFSIPNPNGGVSQWEFYGMYGIYGNVRVSADGGATKQTAFFTGDYKNYFTWDVRKADKLAVLKYFDLNGAALWTKEFPLKSNEDNVDNPYEMQGKIYVYCNEEIQIINPRDGTIVKTVVLTGNYQVFSNDGDTMMFCGYDSAYSDEDSGTGTIIAADADGNILWKNEIKGEPAFYYIKESEGGKTILIQSYGNVVKSFDRTTGELKGEAVE